MVKLWRAFASSQGLRPETAFQFSHYIHLQVREYFKNPTSARYCWPLISLWVHTFSYNYISYKVVADMDKEPKGFVGLATKNLASHNKLWNQFNVKF